MHSGFLLFRTGPSKNKIFSFFRWRSLVEWWKVEEHLVIGIFENAPAAGNAHSYYHENISHLRRMRCFHQGCIICANKPPSCQREWRVCNLTQFMTCFSTISIFFKGYEHRPHRQVECCRILVYCNMKGAHNGQASPHSVAHIVHRLILCCRYL